MIEFKLPALGENIEQGDLVRLMIAPGTAVSEGQAVMELETDKAVVEVPSSVTGTVKEILVKEGEKIKVGQVVFTADGNGTAAAVTEAPREKDLPQKATEGAQPAPSAPRETRSAASASPEPPEAAPPRKRSTDAPAASEFRLQELGENISQGDLIRLMIAPGAKVSEGQPVMELE
ncbi:MAG: biotin/lipoyl-containing protein, partial [Candidatus Sulfotelmatobacter sp.]